MSSISRPAQPAARRAGHVLALASTCRRSTGTAPVLRQFAPGHGVDGNRVASIGRPAQSAARRAGHVLALAGTCR